MSYRQYTDNTTWWYSHGPAASPTRLNAAEALVASRISSLPVLVVGGGIGGLAAALALSRPGLSVKVLEQSPHLGGVGAGIPLGPNAQALEIGRAHVLTP